MTERVRYDNNCGEMEEKARGAKPGWSGSRHVKLYKMGGGDGIARYVWWDF